MDMTETDQLIEPDPRPVEIPRIHLFRLWVAVYVCAIATSVSVLVLMGTFASTNTVVVRSTTCIVDHIDMQVLPDSRTVCWTFYEDTIPIVSGPASNASLCLTRANRTWLTTQVANNIELRYMGRPLACTFFDYGHMYYMTSDPRSSLQRNVWVIDTLSAVLAVVSLFIFVVWGLQLFAPYLAYHCCLDSVDPALLSAIQRIQASPTDTHGTIRLKRDGPPPYFLATACQRYVLQALTNTYCRVVLQTIEDTHFTCMVYWSRKPFSSHPWQIEALVFEHDAPPLYTANEDHHFSSRAS